MDKNKFTYYCTDCGKEYRTDSTMYLCPVCSKGNVSTLPPRGVLKIVYNYQSIREKSKNFDTLCTNDFIDILPVDNGSSFPFLRVGKTPLYNLQELNRKRLPFHIHLKDDSQNPTFSFKDRASALVSAYAREKKLSTIVAASTGNAGSSLAGICASQGQKAIVIVPETAPVAKLTQIIMYGATIIPVKGTYDEAFDLSLKASEVFGWYNRNTAFNPFTIEGKKTVSFELFQQLNHKVPDRIFVPVGDGVIISGVYKGFEDLLMLGLIDRMPTVVAVQSSGSDNLVRNISKGNFSVKPSKTIADSISVDIPRNFFMAQQYISKYSGETIAVPDESIIDASSLLSKSSGIFCEPAAATAFAGLISFQKSGKIDDNSDNVVLLTGSGLKDLKSVSSIIRIPESIYPTINNLQKLLS